MTGRLLVIGLDCMGAEILSPPTLARMPHLAGLCTAGLGGALRSTMPPITVPAWTSMLSGRDPGELGLYGFRNRTGHTYASLRRADGTDVRAPRLWDLVGCAGGRSIVVGVPQTFPPPSIAGDVISGFDSIGSFAQSCAPRSLSRDLADLSEGYAFDVPDFRSVARETLIDTIAAMTRRRLEIMERLLATRPWHLAILCEIGPDRMHHCFWRDHDPDHPAHDPASPFRTAVTDYYRQLDEGIGRLLRQVDQDDHVLVVSDHGALPMRGGIGINEVLREAGWLVLTDSPDAAQPLDLGRVDWSRTRAWASGGYYARVFLNQKGREPDGLVLPEARAATLAELSALLSSIRLPDGRTLRADVLRTGDLYRRTRGYPPDLMVVFENLAVRALGSVGPGSLWAETNDTGPDQANHAWDGLYVLAGPRAPRGRRDASILDVFPTACELLGLDVGAGFSGCSLIAGRAAA